MLNFKQCCALVLVIAISLVISGCGGGAGNPGGPVGTTTAATITVTSTTHTTTTVAAGFTCTANLYLDENAANMSIKGMAMDDTTMSKCADKTMGVWPHTHNMPVKNLRLFAAWKSKWGTDKSVREAAWDKLVKFTQKNNVKVLMGVDSTGDNAENQKQWEWNLELMKRLGKEKILGVSFGNEMLNKYLPDSWWKDFVAWVQAKVKEMDNEGFDQVPITLVYSFALLGPIKSKNNQWLNLFHTTYGDRWRFSVNPYALWSKDLQPKNAATCKQLTDAAISITYIKNVMTVFRKALTDYTGKDDTPIWIGETGWSDPFPASLRWMSGYCSRFCSDETLKIYYQNILEWDGSLNDGVKPPELIFYFSNRDAYDRNDYQPFGMMKSCTDDACKIQGGPLPGPTPPGPSPPPATKSTCAVLGCGNHDTTCWCTESCISHKSCCDDYKAQCQKEPADRMEIV